VFERFTERARQVVVLAQDEARGLGHGYIGTEHLLLGLLREEEGLAARLLESLDVTLEEVRAQVTRIVGEGQDVTTGQIPFTPRAKKVLELSLREALSLGHNWIGTEHVLLGLVREDEGVAAVILRDFDADAETIRNEVIGSLSGPTQRVDPTSAEARSFLPADAPQDLREQLERLRAEKEAAIAAQDFERAARLRAEERRVAREGRLARTERRKPPDEWAGVRRRPAGARVEVIAAIVLAAAAFPLGLLVGWLIWG
jgi:ATP-dependent Clp protease ATP-binding subunit ClpA